ncbi:MAG: hypothetical protein GH155_04515 [Spirochaeta sp.]|nr:hypothetical protein [Spirochaeta sp.]
MLELLEDIHRFQKAPDSEFENKTLADFIYYPSSDLLLKADFFYDVIKKKVTTDLKMFSYYLDSASSSTSQFIQRVTGESKKMIMLGSNNYLG